MAGRRLTPAQAERRARIVQMRRARLTWAEIGRREKITPQRAGKIYEQALAAIPAQQVDAHRTEELDLADMAVNRLMSIAADQEVSARTRVEAWNSIKGWAERKAKLLGLDAPTKHEVLTLDSISAEIMRLEAELAATGESEDDEEFEEYASTAD